MTSPDARLVTWENGTDLVIELPLDVEPEAVWDRLVDGQAAGDWFAPFAVTEAQDADDEAESAQAHITFDLGESELHGEILSVEDQDHVLLELEDFGIVGLRVVPVAVAGSSESAAPESLATLLVLTQSAPSLDEARAIAAENGPMWDTHLRLFARAVGLDIADSDEDTLVDAYSSLPHQSDADDLDGDQA